MGRDVPFAPNKICDLCGKTGAFDFMGDYICMACYEVLPDHDGCGRECSDCYPVPQPPTESLPSKRANIDECHEIAKRHNAQAVIVIRVERNGSVTTSTYGENPEKCHVIGKWAQDWMEHALSAIPFRTVFGWGNKGVPKPLTSAEFASLTPEQLSYAQSFDVPQKA